MLWFVLLLFVAVRARRVRGWRGRRSSLVLLIADHDHLDLDHDTPRSTHTGTAVILYPDGRGRRSHLGAMVCAKCAQKLSKSTAAPDPFRNRNASGMLVSSASASTSSIAGKSSAGSSSASVLQKSASGASRKIGENKLLSKNRFNPLGGSQCQGCKARLSQDRAKYCGKRASVRCVGPSCSSNRNDGRVLANRTYISAGKAPSND
ncbi:hypothetical protein V8E36_002764 [Tilletia maclaganii]